MINYLDLKRHVQLFNVLHYIAWNLYDEFLLNVEEGNN